MFTEFLYNKIYLFLQCYTKTFCDIFDTFLNYKYTQHKGKNKTNIEHENRSQLYTVLLLSLQMLWEDRTYLVKQKLP